MTNGVEDPHGGEEGEDIDGSYQALGGDDGGTNIAMAWRQGGLAFVFLYCCT